MGYLETAGFSHNLGSEQRPLMLTPKRGVIKTGGYGAHPVNLNRAVSAGIADPIVFMAGGGTHREKRGPPFPTRSGRMGHPAS